MPKHLLFVLLLILFSVTSHAQLPDLRKYAKPEDKIKAAKAFCSKMLKVERYDSLLMGAKIGYNICKTTKDDGMNSVLCYYIGAGYSSLAKIDSAIFYFKLSEQYGVRTGLPERVINAEAKILEQAPRNSDLKLEYFHKLELNFQKYKNNPALGVEIAANLANVYNDENQYENSLKYHFEELKYGQKLKDSTAIGTSMVNIGNTYIQMGNQNKALEYLSGAIPYLNDYKRGQMMAYYNIAACYTDLNKIDAAISNFQKSNDIAKKVNDTVAMYSIQLKLGTAYVSKKQYSRAEAMLVPATLYGEKIKEPAMMSDGYESLGQLNADQKNNDAAITWFLKAIETAKKYQMKERVAEIYNALSKAAAAKGDYQKAYQYHTFFSLYNDTLVKESNKKSVAELEQKFQTEKKQQQINLLNQKEKTQAAELQSQRRTKYFLFAGLVLVVLIVLLMFRSYRIKQNANLLLEGKNVELEEKNHTLHTLNGQLDEANQSKAKLFGILSHDLRAPVGSLFQFLSLQKNNSGKLSEEQQQKHNERIINSAENLMGSMEDLLIWSKSQMQSFAPKIQEVTTVELIDETIELHADFAKGRQISLLRDDINDIILKTDVNFLKIVLRNITSNGIKFTPAGGSITFSAKNIDGKVLFIITDTGQGMSEAQTKNLFEWSSIRSDSSGMGLRLAKEFTERLGGEITVDSVQGRGTTFFLTFPLSYQF